MRKFSRPPARVGDFAPWLFHGVDLKLARPASRKSADHRVRPPSSRGAGFAVVAGAAVVVVVGAGAVVCGLTRGATASETPAGATAWVSGRTSSPVSAGGSARNVGPVLAAATLAPARAPK